MENIREDFITNNTPHPKLSSFDMVPHLKSKLMANVWGKVYRSIEIDIRDAIRDNILINMIQKSKAEGIKKQNKWRILAKIF